LYLLYQSSTTDLFCISKEDFSCTCLACPVTPAQADGDRISEFGTAGVAVFTHPIQPEALTIAPDGAIIAAGQLAADYAAAHEIPVGSLGVIKFAGSAGPDVPLMSPATWLRMPSRFL
jgi:hypothetical protein